MIGYRDKRIPRDKWIEDSLWKKITETIPIACMDVIFQRNDLILYGYRIIDPYRNVWAFPGGRFLYGENIKGAAKRIAKEYGLTAKDLYLIGAFQKTYVARSDITVAVVSVNPAGEVLLDKKEFSKLAWLSSPPAKLGAYYQTILSKWSKICSSRDFLHLSKI